MKYIKLGRNFKYSLQGARPQSGSSSPCDRWNPTLYLVFTSGCSLASYPSQSGFCHSHMSRRGGKHTHECLVYALVASSSAAWKEYSKCPRKQNTVYSYKSTHSSTYATHRAVSFGLLPWGRCSTVIRNARNHLPDCMAALSRRL
jgi:hypothetical protein